MQNIAAVASEDSAGFAEEGRRFVWFGRAERRAQASHRHAYPAPPSGRDTNYLPQLSTHQWSLVMSVPGGVAPTVNQFTQIIELCFFQ